jgi:integrase/recombinase XerC
MRDIRFCRADRAGWLVTGPLEAPLDAYRQHLTDGGYAAGTIARYLSGLAHLSQWMQRGRMRIERIDDALVTEFLDDHLPRCRCQGLVLRGRGELSSALGHLLVVLRDRKVIAPPAEGTTPVDVELRCYGQYMTQVRGLAPKTRSIGLRIVGRLLT